MFSFNKKAQTTFIKRFYSSRKNLCKKLTPSTDSSRVITCLNSRKSFSSSNERNIPASSLQNLRTLLNLCGTTKSQLLKTNRVKTKNINLVGIENSENPLTNITKKASKINSSKNLVQQQMEVFPSGQKTLARSGFRKFNNSVSLSTYGSQEARPRYSRNTEIKLVTIGLASANRIRQWAEKTLPNGKVIGEVLNAETLHYKTFKPIYGGLFCERIFGPTKDHYCGCGKKFDLKNYLNPEKFEKNKNLSSLSSNATEDTNLNVAKRYFCRTCQVEYTYATIRRTQLGYIKLATPVTHVWFVKGMPNYMSLLLDMKRKDLNQIIYNYGTITFEKSIKGKQLVTLKPSEIYEKWFKATKTETKIESTRPHLVVSENVQRTRPTTSKDLTLIYKTNKHLYYFKKAFASARAKKENRTPVSQTTATSVRGTLQSEFFSKMKPPQGAKFSSYAKTVFGSKKQKGPSSLRNQLSDQKTWSTFIKMFAVDNITVFFRNRLEKTTSSAFSILNLLWLSNRLPSSVVSIGADKRSLSIASHGACTGLSPQANLFQLTSNKSNRQETFAILSNGTKGYLPTSKNLLELTKHISALTIRRKATNQMGVVKKNISHLHLTNGCISRWKTYITRRAPSFLNKKDIQTKRFLSEKQMTAISNLLKDVSLNSFHPTASSKSTFVGTTQVKRAKKKIKLNKLFKFSTQPNSHLSELEQKLLNDRRSSLFGLQNNTCEAETISEKALHSKSEKTVLKQHQEWEVSVSNLLFIAKSNTFLRKCCLASPGSLKIYNIEARFPKMSKIKIDFLLTKVPCFAGTFLFPKKRRSWLSRFYLENQCRLVSIYPLLHLQLEMSGICRALLLTQQNLVFPLSLKSPPSFSSQKTKLGLATKGESTSLSGAKLIACNGKVLYPSLIDSVKETQSFLQNEKKIEPLFISYTQVSHFAKQNKPPKAEIQKIFYNNLLPSLINNLYCLSHRYVWEEDQQKNWRRFSLYFYAPKCSTAESIPIYINRNYDEIYHFSDPYGSYSPSNLLSSALRFGQEESKSNNDHENNRDSGNNFETTLSYLKLKNSTQNQLKTFVGGMNINTAFSGPGILQKFLNDFTYRELKKMDKQNRILLVEYNKHVKILKRIMNPRSLKSRQEYYKACHIRDLAIRRTKLIRKVFTNTNPHFSNPFASLKPGFASPSPDLSTEMSAGLNFRDLEGGAAAMASTRNSVNGDNFNIILTALPVLPPDLRPIVKMDGKQATADLNTFYKNIIYRNERLKKFLSEPALSTAFEMKYAQRLVQESVDNLIQNGKSGVTPVKDARGRLLKSLSDSLKGKQGRFRQYLLGKRVDYSARSVIVVGPRLKLHECGLPKEIALTLYLPFLIKRILNQKLALTVPGAKGLIQKQPPLIWQMLREIMKTCPVLLNRAPTLHRLGFQAFQPKLIEGKAILLHPLVCPAFNADFDGDQMAVHIPITQEAKAEAWKLMLARNNLLSPATGEPLVLPSQDMVLGCYYLTTNCTEKFISKKQGNNFYFSNFNEALKAYEHKVIDIHSLIWVNVTNLIQAESNPLSGNNNTLLSPSNKLLNSTTQEQPLEIRIPIFKYKTEAKYQNSNAVQVSLAAGKKLIVYSKSHSLLTFNGTKINHIIRTTPGRIFFNSLIQNALQKRPVLLC